MANLKGSPELQARLKAVRLCFKPIGRKWAETGVSLAPPMVPVRTGRLRASFRVKSATQRKAVIGAHYTAYFVDAGVKSHSLAKRGGKGQDRTVFAKKHPGYRARPFRARMAAESLRRHPMAETLIAEWNKGRLMVVTRISFQAAMRAAAVALLTDYAASAGVKLQVYPGRPTSVNPPTAYVDRITESFEYPGSVTWRQRTPRAEVVVLFGIFDSKEAADQKDAFVDGFLDWVTDRVHAAGANTTIGLVNAEDEPNFSLDWRPASSTNGPDATYYAVRLTLEGFAGG